MVRQNILNTSIDLALLLVVMVLGMPYFIEFVRCSLFGMFGVWYVWCLVLRFEDLKQGSLFEDVIFIAKEMR